METFPTAAFEFQDAKPELVRRNIKAGASLSGLVQVIDQGGAGFWAVTLSNAKLRTREQNLEWRRLEALLGDEATLFEFPTLARLTQPLTAKLDDTPQVVAALTADRALNITTLSFDFAGPLGLVGGEDLSIVHDDVGKRMYRIITISDGSGVSDNYTVKIRPWLRGAVTVGTPLDFDNPGFVARVDGSMAASVNLLRFGDGAVKVVEAFADA